MVEVERVQVLASTYLSNDTIPSHMIRPENEQPRNTTFRSSEKLQQLPEVPVIDFSGPNGEEKLVETILDASCEWGLFQIVNHGIPSDVISNFQKVGQKFFELPQEEKELYAKTPGEDLKNIQGYGTKLLDHIPNNGWLDHIFNKIWPPSVINYDFWPKNPPEYREAVEEYASCLHKVVDKLLSNLSVGLGLEKHEVKEAIGGDDLVYDMKINYYPPCPRPDLALGSGAHTDLCVVTILLLDDIQGLQVFRDGNWIDVNFVSNGLIIHIGDQIEILSNGRCKSALHRSKVDKDKIRMSWPVFMEPPLEFEVGPHPKLVSENNPPKYKAKKFSDYAQCKLTGTPQ